MAESQGCLSAGEAALKKTGVKSALDSSLTLKEHITYMQDR
jgi:hypothetical protein